MGHVVNAADRLAANRLCPHYVHIVCGTLDRPPQAFVGLDSYASAAATPMQHNHTDVALRRHIRAREAADGD